MDFSKLLASYEQVKKSFHKYIRKIVEGKKTKYIYEEDKNEAVKKVEFCTSNLLDCNFENAQEKGEEFIRKWAKEWNPGFKCETLNNTKVALDVKYNKRKNRDGISIFHLAYKGIQFGEEKRTQQEIFNRARLLPCAKEILTDKTKGIVKEVRVEKNKVEYSIYGKVKIDGKVQIICVIVSKFKPKVKTYISTINKAISNNVDIALIKDVYLVNPKTLTNQLRLNLGLSELPCHHSKTMINQHKMSNKSTIGERPVSCEARRSDRISKHGLSIAQNNKMSMKEMKKNMTKAELNSYEFSTQGSRIHKSFDILVKDITENNKQQKIEQVEKALNAVYQNKPFIVQHIPLDDSRKYGDITLRITNFDKNKIEKAVHKLALSLDGTVKPTKGEAFRYKSQEDLTSQFLNELTEKTKSVYDYVIGYFGLPEIRVVSKADLMNKGKIVYNPETGEPIKQSEWDNFVKGLENFLNRNYKGIGQKIVLNSQQLGVILDRIQARKSMKEVEKLTLEDIQKQNTFKRVDWINPSVKNMTDIFGDTFDRWRQARIQIAMQSAASRIQHVTDSMRNDIQQILIDGIKNKESKSVISQKLFDKCVGLNRDFQKIADTETVENLNNAFIQEEVAKTPQGEKVYFKRFEFSDDNTCKKCAAIKGTIALWSDVALPDEHIDDPYAEYAIWDGKNAGEMPNGVLHPYCRGSWARYYPDVD